MFGLSCAPTLRICQEVVGYSASILVHSEKLLYSCSDYQKAISWAQPQGLKKYRSLLDALVALTFPEMKLHVRRFYKNDGPSMEEMYTKEQILEYDLQLCRVIAFVFVLWNARGELHKGRNFSIDLPHLNETLNKGD